MIRSLAAISAGASLGAILRWGLGAALNTLFPTIPPGTWIANISAHVAGSLLMTMLGLASASLFKLP